MSYEIITNSLMVKPSDEPIYSEQVTIIGIDDEVGGAFVTVAQNGNKINIDEIEWPHIKKAIDTMMDVANKQNAKIKV